MTTVASCNLRFTLSDTAFEAGLREVLATKPDLVALQEAGPNRNRILERVANDLGYKWARPKSPDGSPTMPVMWRTDRYTLRHIGAVRLARAEFVGHLPGRKSKLDASWATEVVLDDLFVKMDALDNKAQVVLIDYHLTAEVQQGRSYRRDPSHLPRVLRHRRERRRLAKRGRMHTKRGRRTFLAGDGNYDEMTLRGFMSCWSGRDGSTLGNRAVDIIFAATRGKRLRTIKTPSDHRALVVEY